MTPTFYKGLKIIQGNILYCKLASSTLCDKFEKGNLDFALIQEPYVSNKRFIKWNRLKGTMFTDLTAKKVRTCIFVKESPNFTAVALSEYCNIDLTTIRVDYKNKDRPETVILTSAYLPYEEQPPSQLLQRLISYCSSKKFELVIGSDANAHHTIWSSTNINPRGKLLSEYLSSTNVHIINKGNAPTFINKIREEVIDITLATQKIARDIKNWRVDPQVTFSDHRWITFDIVCDVIPPQKFRNPRKTNWTLYREILVNLIDQNPKEIESVDDIDSMCNNLSNAIIRAYENSCPLSNPLPPGKSLNGHLSYLN